MQLLPQPLNTGPEGRGISDDGSIIVGTLFTGISGDGGRAFRWTEATGIETISNTLGFATDVSDDGSVIVGGLQNSGQNIAFRWTEAGGYSLLGFNATGPPGPSVSGDGRAVFGRRENVSPGSAVRYVDGYGLMDFGTLPNSPLVPRASGASPSFAYDASYDGSVVIGRATISGGGPLDQVAFLWDETRGSRSLEDVLIADFGLGASLLNWELISARGVSADGRTIVGYGTNPTGNSEAFIAHLGTRAPRSSTWAFDGDGNWSTFSNWTNGVPNSAGDGATFGAVITTSRTLTVDLPIALSRIDFDSPNGYSIAGTSSLTLDATNGEAAATVIRGNHTIRAPLTFADNTVFHVGAGGNLSVIAPRNASGVILTKTGAGTLTLNSVLVNGLYISNGTVRIVHAGTVERSSQVSTLSIAGGAIPSATLDLNNQAVIINYSGASPVATVRDQILAGRGGSGLGATWAGQGITSSAAATANTTDPESRSVGYAENRTLPLGRYTTFRDRTVDSTSVLIAYTRTGDANLDGVVNDDDVTIVGATYAPGVSNASWALGDFDYNGFVDDDDVTLLGAFYDPHATPLIASPPTSTEVAAIPEPSTCVLGTFTLSLIAVALLRRRVVH
jgi:hypothetical protein